jgi:hypothetical protein
MFVGGDGGCAGLKLTSCEKSLSNPLATAVAAKKYVGPRDGKTTVA